MKIKHIIKACTPYGIIKFREEYFIKNIFNCFRKSIKYFDIRENSVLVVEALSYHGEVLPGIINYLLELGYNVDVIFNQGNRKKGNGRNDFGLLYCLTGDNRVRTKIMTYNNINLLLRSKIVNNYRHIVLNSFYDWMENKHLYKVNLFKLKPVCMMHNPDINHAYFKTNKIISLVKIDCPNRKPPFIVNSHFFGKFPYKEKSKKTVFFALNTKKIYYRNLHLLFSACDLLYKKGIYDFHVKIIGNGIEIPDRFHDNFQIFGFLDNQKMYKEITESDFILALIDQASVKYTNKASGSYALSYGFLKPIVLHSKFSVVSGFNNGNSILYDDNDLLSDAMEKCINMSKDNYSSLVLHLEKAENVLYNTSLNNFKEVLEVSI